MTDVCGIIGDLKREAQGVYVFRKLTLLGFDGDDAVVQKLKELGFKVSDEHTADDGVEITHTSPFQVMRALGKHFNFKPCAPVSNPAPGDRQSVLWTLVGGKGLGSEVVGIVGDVKRECEGQYVIPTCTVFGLNGEEVAALAAKGLSVGDADLSQEGVEVHNCSPFKVMRVLCREFGWTTTGDVVQTPAPSDRICSMWTLTRKI